MTAVGLTLALLVSPGVLAVPALAATSAGAPASPAIRLEVEGRPLVADPPPFIVSGRTMVPIRVVAEALGAQVQWLPGPQQVLVTLPSRPGGAKQVVLTIGRNRARVGGAEVPLDVPARIVSGRSFVPLRFVAEALEATVEWSPATYVVRVWPQHSRVTRVAWSKEAGAIHFRVELSTPVVSYRLDAPPGTADRLVLTLTPALAAIPQPQVSASDPVLKGVQFKQNGRALQIIVDLRRSRRYRLERDPDGLGFTLKLSYEVTGVEFSKDGLGPRVLIRTEGRVTYRTMTLTQPDRLVIDFPWTVRGLNLSDVAAPAEVAALGVQRVRVGEQPPDAPDAVRVVVDLAGPRQPVITQVADGLEIRFPGQLSGRRIWVDAGHGGDDPGAIGPGGTREKQLTLQVALRLRDLLAASGAQVLMSRTDDSTVDLYARPRNANAAHADIFVSIHINSATSPEASGIETYYWYNNPQSARLAQAIHRRLVEELGLPDRGIKTDNFVVLRETQMPSTLVELGFISNPNEERLLADPSFQQRAAIAIQKGIFDFFEQE